MGAQEIRVARAVLAATIANEVRLNGGKPVSEDNPHVKAAKKAVDDAVAEVDRANDPWNNA
ncbi:hypothetical protein ABZ912_20105 [Nonomuraea angiospora]|uniref:hypothetical protein n=1 Tax=Nonomuraea angiospora TaxID=46172 RepID=UPI0033C57C4A